jgi:hypothetical protein
LSIRRARPSNREAPDSSLRAERVNSGLVGPPADIHSVGAILYALLTGRSPFQAANPIETMAALAKLMIPTVGFIDSRLGGSMGEFLDDPSQAADARTFFVLCAMLSLGFLAPAMYLVRRRVTRWKRWTIYPVGGACLLLIAASAYD